MNASNSTHKLKTNLDTDFLKLIAAITMMVDHIGFIFFPQYAALRWIGRLSFPLFCYCLTVGLLYTHNIKKYLLRLAVFAVVAQIIYAIFLPGATFYASLIDWNIFFTLFFSLLFMWGITAKKWFTLALSAISLFVLLFFGLQYGASGIALMLIFCFCRNMPRMGACLYVLYYLPALWANTASMLSLNIWGLCIDWSFFAVFAAPLIFLPTYTKIRINKWFFYFFYPVHLGAISALDYILKL